MVEPSRMLSIVATLEFCNKINSVSQRGLQTNHFNNKAYLIGSERQTYAKNRVRINYVHQFILYFIQICTINKDYRNQIS